MRHPLLDRVARAYYELSYKYRYFTCNGQTFQEFFSAIMEKRHGDDFSHFKPWGPKADRQCDGYLIPSRTIFNVYAPNELETARLARKVRRDFEAAITQWSRFVACWTFVHNSRTGLGPEIEALLLTLELGCRKIAVERWGVEELWQQVLELTPADLASLLGPGISDSDILDLRTRDLLPILKALAEAKSHDMPDAEVAVPGKIQFNTFSISTLELLYAGTGKAALVKDMFRNVAAKDVSHRAVTAFKKRYALLKGQALDADMIVYELLSFTAGPTRQLPHEHAAALVIVAHLLEACHIVERPSETALENVRDDDVYLGSRAGDGWLD